MTDGNFGAQDDCLVSWKLGEAQSAPWRPVLFHVADVDDVHVDAILLLVLASRPCRR